jgi:hypothetical protein
LASLFLKAHPLVGGDYQRFCIYSFKKLEKGIIFFSFHFVVGYRRRVKKSFAVFFFCFEKFVTLDRSKQMWPEDILSKTERRYYYKQIIIPLRHTYFKIFSLENKRIFKYFRNLFLCQTPFYWDLSPKPPKNIKKFATILIFVFPQRAKTVSPFFKYFGQKIKLLLFTVKEYDIFRIRLGGGGGGYCDGMYRVPHKIH